MGSLVNDAGVTVFEGEIIGDAAGQPKSNSGVTFTGIPGASSALAWEAFFPAGGDFPGVLNKLFMTPVRVTEAITVTEVELLTEGAIMVDANVRAAISAADEFWQPTGPVLFQDTILIPGTSAQFDAFDFPGLSIALTPGMYLFAVETDEPTLQLDGRPTMFENGVHCDDASPGNVLNALIADHVYGAFAAPMPAWDAVSIYNTSTAKAWVNPFLVKWTNG